jgi:hypothetical protein
MDVPENLSDSLSSRPTTSASRWATCSDFSFKASSAESSLVCSSLALAAFASASLRAFSLASSFLSSSWICSCAVSSELEKKKGITSQQSIRVYRKQNMRHLLLKLSASSRNPIKRLAMPSISFVIVYKKSRCIGRKKYKKLDVDKGKKEGIKEQGKKTYIVQMGSR